MVYLVYGPPCSGKTTYVREHMKRGDIVSDVDDLYAAISGADPHNAEDINVHDTAILLNEALLDMIRDRRGKWKNAFVISLANTEKRVRDAMERVNADEAVFIDTPPEVCMQRAQTERPFYFRWVIEDWFMTGDFFDVESSNNAK